MEVACSFGILKAKVRGELFQISLYSFAAAELDSTIQFEVGFTATSILHPATYLNKVLVASSEGKLQLWNIRTQYVQLLL